MGRASNRKWAKRATRYHKLVALGRVDQASEITRNLGLSYGNPPLAWPGWLRYIDRWQRVSRKFGRALAGA